MLLVIFITEEGLGDKNNRLFRSIIREAFF
jgi:hypothetical protein